MLSPMKLVAVHDGGGCGWYRLVVPFTELGRHGFDVTIASNQDERYKDFDFSAYDIVAGQRFDNFDGMAGWRRLRTSSNRLVYDNDDDVFSITPDNREAYEAYTRLELRAAVQGFLTYSDLVTVTNETLAGVFEEYAYQRPAVLPNFIPEWVLGLGRTMHGGIRIGYMGGASHSRDIEQATNAVRRAVLEDKRASLHLVGSDYRSFFRLPPNRMSLTNWVNVNDHPEAFYRNLDFDIGIAPLKDTRFSRSKSYVKALEYNARGIPVIASDVGPYKSYIRHGENGFLVKQPHEWSKYLHLLVNDSDLRADMSAKSKAVASEYTIENNWRMWAHAYEGLFK